MPHSFSVEKRCIVERTVRTSSRNFAVLLFDEVDLYDVACLMQVASVAGRHYNWRPFRLLSVARQAGLVETRSQLRVEAKLQYRKFNQFLLNELFGEEAVMTSPITTLSSAQKTVRVVAGSRGVPGEGR